MIMYCNNQNKVLYYNQMAFTSKIYIYERIFNYGDSKETL